MATITQYNPNAELNARLLAAGASKTVYALVTPETESTKSRVFGNHGDSYRALLLEQCRDAWTNKQDNYHESFFNVWYQWSKQVVDFDREKFPFYYPTAGASEPLRHLIYDLAAHARGSDRAVHVFKGEYEGYKAMAEAAGLRLVEHDRADWRDMGRPEHDWEPGDLFFISQPSAIDGMVWNDFNAFVGAMPPNSIVADVTYVGAVPREAVPVRFHLDAKSIRNIVFSLSKPFGAYYDRIGGVWCREQDLGLFGNKWFKNLTSLALGWELMTKYGVFHMAETYAHYQRVGARFVSDRLGIELKPADVYVLATAPLIDGDPLSAYLERAGRQRLCLTPAMAKAVGTSGPIL